jgi:hypothetical protein
MTYLIGAAAVVLVSSGDAGAESQREGVHGGHGEAREGGREGAREGGCAASSHVWSLLWGWPKERGGKQTEKSKCGAKNGEERVRENGSKWTASTRAVRPAVPPGRPVYSITEITWIAYLLELLKKVWLFWFCFITCRTFC